MVYHEGFPLIDEVFFALCKAIDTPVSLGCWLRFKHNQLDLAQLEINPRNYLDSSAFSQDYACVSYLAKYQGLNTGLDLEAEAMRKFTSSEEQCKRTNERFIHGRNFGFTKPIEQILYIARRKIAAILGPYEYDKIVPGFGWGPGATLDISRRSAFIDTKMCKLPISVTPRGLPYLKGILREDLHWSSVILDCCVTDIEGPFCWLDDKVFLLTEHCVIDTVPKNAKTHRVIAKESRVGAFLQKGFGSFFRKRLKRVGIDLDDQSANQRGAYEALRSGLATLDLRAASDTVSKEVVFDLLPVDWAIALDDVRSRQAKLPNGETITLEKFSSMGNGFTFELETLIFYGLAFAVRAYMQQVGPLLVYGDDIICEKRIAKCLTNILGFCGFSLNKEKSFVSGLFYESCGKHYFNGVDVTPCYQKEIVETLSGHVRLHNRLLRAARRLNHGFGWLNPHFLLARCVAKRQAIRLDGFSSFQLPFGAEGDEGYLVFADEFIAYEGKKRLRQDDNLGLRCPVMRQTFRRLPAHEGALLAHSLQRGVVTATPFWGDVVDPAVEFIPVRGYRWVMPSGEFGLVLNE